MVPPRPGPPASPVGSPLHDTWSHPRLGRVPSPALPSPARNLGPCPAVGRCGSLHRTRPTSALPLSPRSGPFAAQIFGASSWPALHLFRGLTLPTAPRLSELVPIHTSTGASAPEKTGNPSDVAVRVHYPVSCSSQHFLLSKSFIYLLTRLRSRLECELPESQPSTHPPVCRCIPSAWSSSDRQEALNKPLSECRAPLFGAGRGASWPMPQPRHTSPRSVRRLLPGDAVPPKGEASFSLVVGVRLAGRRPMLCLTQTRLSRSLGSCSP